MMPIRISDDNLLAVLPVLCTALAVLLTLGGWLLVSGHFAVGVFAGGGVALGNFFWLRNALTRTLQQPAARARSSATIRFLTRLGVTGFILWLLIAKAGLNIFGLLLGLSVLVAGIMLLTIHRLLHAGG